MNMYYVYILKNAKNKQLYIGYTNNLRRRLKEHEQGKNKTTMVDKSWFLIYYEACLNQQDATRREKYFKTSQGRRFVKRRLKEYFYLNKN